jgi:hypothetical protein
MRTLPASVVALTLVFGAPHRLAAQRFAPRSAPFAGARRIPAALVSDVQPAWAERLPAPSEPPSPPRASAPDRVPARSTFLADSATDRLTPSERGAACALARAALGMATLYVLVNDMPKFESDGRPFGEIGAWWTITSAVVTKTPCGDEGHDDASAATARPERSMIRSGASGLSVLP